MPTINSNVPTVKIFASEDYKEIIRQIPQFDQFLQDLNRFIIPTSNLFNGGLAPNINTTEEFYPLTITANGLTGSSNTATFTPKKFVGTPNGVFLISCQANSATPIIPTSAPQINWTLGSNGMINVNAIYGLQTGITYNLVLRIC